MENKIVTIEINFPVGVELPDGFERALDGLINMVCEKYEKEHPNRSMWVFGAGGKMLTNPFMTDDLKFDMSCLHIEIAEREASEKELRRRREQKQT